MIIKIYGERNSGTGFLEFLLRKNVKNHLLNIFVDETVCKKKYAWKHGYPIIFNRNIINPKLENEPVLYICIFRNIEGWLKSMYNNPYHLRNTGEKYCENFHTFLSRKQEIQRRGINACKIDYTTNKIANIDFDKVNNIIHINLSFLQKEPEFLLYVIKNVYNIELEEKINTNIPYTKKIGKTQKIDKYNNIIYDIDIKKYQNVINRFKNKEYEKYINTLKIRCKKNGNIIN
jgi:hypothetical protein